jgi:hypothetical protein
MAANVLDEINRLSTERSELYREAGNHRLSGQVLRQRAGEIQGELNRLWDRRRRERAGRLEGIDLLVHQAYEQLYGRDFDTAPVPVSEETEPATRPAA